MSSATIDINIKTLPYGLRPIVTTLGADQAIALLTKHGGEGFFIPAKPNETTRVAKVFGLAMAGKWAEEHANKVYQVPKCDKLMLQVRDRVICAALEKETETIMQLTRRFNLTRQRIWEIYKGHSEDDGQLSFVM